MTGLTEDFSKQSLGEWRSLKLQLVLRRYLLTSRLPGQLSSWLTPTFWDVLGVLITSPATPPASQTSVIREQFNRFLLQCINFNNYFLLKTKPGERFLLKFVTGTLHPRCWAWSTISWDSLQKSHFEGQDLLYVIRKIWGR